MQANASRCSRNPIRIRIQSNPIQESARVPRFTPPTVDEVATYCRERGNTVDAERFVDFYASKGWKIGKEPMKDWKAAVRTWEKREAEDTTAKPKKAAKAPQSFDTDEFFAKALAKSYGGNGNAQ